ncbi:MAG: TIGR00341 family protein [Desulfobacterales bacterium]|jgi:uncharacterized hydrophobic protein (TIGR00341 family)
MAQRLMQISLPDHAEEEIDDLLEGCDILGRWHDDQSRRRLLLQVIVSADEAEPLMDRLDQWFSGSAHFRILLLNIEAALPRPVIEEEAPPRESSSEEESDNRKGRISREELYTEVTDSIGTSKMFVAMVVLSAIVTMVGLLRDDVAVLIGAMVIAPFLGPNVALALATTLGDASLARKALKMNLTGLLIAIAFAVAAGALLPIDIGIPAIVARTRIGFDDIILALAAGSAGTFAFTSGASGAIIGVMVAVALMPPLITFGMLLGAGSLSLSMNALLLTAANIICVNLAGVATFLAQGVAPRSWWEAKKARKASLKAATAWVLLLAALMAILVWTNLLF